MTDRLACPHCTRTFADANARWQHARKKHRGKRVADLRPPEDESLADIAIEATWKRAAGEPLDPLEESLL